MQVLVWTEGSGSVIKKNPEVQTMPKRKKKILKVSPVLNKKSIVDLTLNYQTWPHNAIMQLIYDYKHLNSVVLGHV